MTSRARGWFRLAVIAETGLAAAAALMFIGRKNMWLDEGYSFVAAHRTLPNLFRLLTHDENNMGAYYLALHAWLPLGRSEATIRYLSVVPAVVAVPVVAALARKLYSARVGLVAALLTALNPMVIRYAQEARGYSLAFFVSAVSSLLFVSYARRPRTGVAIAWGLVSALGCYVHYFVVLTLLAQVLSLAALPPPRLRRELFVGVGLVVLLGLPLLVFVVTRGGGQLSSAVGFSLRDPALLLYRFAGSIALALIALALLAIAARDDHRDLRQGVRRWETTFVWTWLLVPPLVTLGASVVHPLWRERYLIVSLPAFVILIAHGLDRLPLVPVRVVTAVAIVALCGAALGGYYTGHVKNAADWRSASAFTFAELRPSAPVWFIPASGTAPFAYYAWRDHRPPQAALGLAPHPFDARIHPKVSCCSAVRATVEGRPQVWVILLAPNTTIAAEWRRREDRIVARTLGVRFRLAVSKDFGPLLTVRRYDAA